MGLAGKPMNLDNRYDCDLAFLSKELSSGRLTSEMLTRYAIERHESRGAILNAYRSWLPETALEMARHSDRLLASGMPYQALQGIPISIKDIFGLEGHPIFAGSGQELPAKWRRSGPFVADLAAQYSVFIGKTHTVEFAYGGLGVNNHWGTPKNPWDTVNHRVPGGSSSGAGISLWEGSAWIALGTDTSGSVRVPASYTGNVGLKTSLGLWSTDGVVPLSPTLDTIGILTRTAADAQLAFHSISHLQDYSFVCAQLAKQQNCSRHITFRIGIDDGLMWRESDPVIAQMCLDALHRLEKDGCQLISFDFPESEEAIEMRNLGGPVSAELIAFLQSELPDWYDSLDPVIRERIKMGGDISATEYLRRLRQINGARQTAMEHFHRINVIASPTVPISPPMMSEISTPEDYMSRNLLALQNTTVGSFLDFCAITIPIGLDPLGMPVGLQFMSRSRNESILLALGLRLEKIVRDNQLMPY